MDTGVVFCKRKDFESIGGYNESLKFAEDVEFLWRLTKLGRERGQRLTRLRKCKALNSTRKFDQFGDWHYVALLGKFFWSLLFPGYSIDKFAHKYWYSDAGSPMEKPTWEKSET
ncbi:MAG: hypothetical protein AMK69_19050 [Nitrospira bacterium SG8_3]|nr:MAG: hypothetical protein AMK69_19050 [Nitrospira bacterium SG8_3]